MTPIQILLARAPCYQESARITSLIELAETEIGPDAYGDLRSNAVALLTLQGQQVLLRPKPKAIYLGLMLHQNRQSQVYPVRCGGKSLSL